MHFFGSPVFADSCGKAWILVRSKWDIPLLPLTWLCIWVECGTGRVWRCTDGDTPAGEGRGSEQLRLASPFCIGFRVKRQNSGIVPLWEECYHHVVFVPSAGLGGADVNEFFTENMLQLKTNNDTVTFLSKATEKSFSQDMTWQNETNCSVRSRMFPEEDTDTGNFCRQTGQTEEGRM